MTQLTSTQIQLVCCVISCLKSFVSLSSLTSINWMLSSSILALTVSTEAPFPHFIWIQSILIQVMLVDLQVDLWQRHRSQCHLQEGGASTVSVASYTVDSSMAGLLFAYIQQCNSEVVYLTDTQKSRLCYGSICSGAGLTVCPPLKAEIKHS